MNKLKGRHMDQLHSMGAGATPEVGADGVAPLRIGLVGVGKIARDQHLPAIASNPDFQLEAVVTSREGDSAVPAYHDLASMLAGEPSIEAVILCQPPSVRFEAARECLLAGKHVFLEKPPGATVSEVEALKALATKQGLTLFASWHSREAAGVAFAREWLASRSLQVATITWKEDVRIWHPGQTWIWEPGGFGVFDPGINALSILTTLVSEHVRIASADLVYPSNCAAPIAASLAMKTESGADILAEFDFLQPGDQTWEIALECQDGSRARLIQGGARWLVGQDEVRLDESNEYVALYARFLGLVRARCSDVDLAPIQLVADAFLVGRTRFVAPFNG